MKKFFNRVLLLSTLLIVFVGLGACNNSQSPLPLSAILQRANHTPLLADDLDINPLISGIENNIAHIKKSGAQGAYNFNGSLFEKKAYMAALEFLLGEYKKSPTKEHFLFLTKKYFDFYQIFGLSGKGDMRLTAYIEAEIEGSPEKTDEFSVALYRKPPDMIEIPLKLFAHPDFSHLMIGSAAKMLGRLENGRVLPYYSREEIDRQKKLAFKGLELCYVRPFDAFFMHIQGSGIVRLPNSKILRLGYAGQNGRKYIDYHDAWIGKVPLTKLNLRDIGGYLSSLPQEEVMKLLYMNPSYVFFREISGRPITSMGSEVIDGRTVATDSRYFPKGALAYISFTKYSGQKSSRFVIDQDAGGAIKGPGRVDLFVGTGTKNLEFRETTGSMYYLLPNSVLMKQLDAGLIRREKAQN